MPFNYTPGQNYDESEPSTFPENQPEGWDPMQGPANAMQDPAAQDLAVAAQATMDGTPQPTEKQPGRRLSIKEYIEKIRQMQAQGMNVVPTFTNVEGGGLDVSQGEFEGEDVRSYVTPEWQQGADGSMQRGPAHPATQAQEKMGGGTGKSKNIFDPRSVNSIAMEHLPDAIDKFEQQKQGAATPEEINAIGNALRKQTAEMIFNEQKQFKSFFDKDVEMKTMWTAWETGDIQKALDARQKAMSNEKRQKMFQEFYDDALTQQRKEPGMPLMDDATGQEFQSPEEYARYHVEELFNGMNDMIEDLQESSKYGGQSNAQKDQAKAEAAASAVPGSDQMQGGGAEGQGRTIVKRGTYKGRKVVQYDDGTTEYAD